jgi:aryl sulfotransferase
VTQSRPATTRIYVNHHLNSLRWSRVRFRDDDIVISTSYKAGTTWTQRIVSLLIFGAGPLPARLGQLSPWIDARFEPRTIEQVVVMIDAQRHRRFLKSHLPLDALPWDERVKYVCVARDGRDVFMSLANHYGAYTDLAYQLLNSGPDFAGEPIPRCPNDIHVLFDGWLHRASFPWEQDGWPMWSHFSQVQSFWNFRDEPNIYLLHYADLKADLRGEMERLADFLGIAVPAETWPALVEEAGFEAMKRDALEHDEGPSIFEGGANTFFFKGTNGRWRDVLTADELREYDKAVARALTPDCAEWLEKGRVALERDCG